VLRNHDDLEIRARRVACADVRDDIGQIAGREEIADPVVLQQVDHRGYVEGRFEDVAPAPSQSGRTGYPEPCEIGATCSESRRFTAGGTW